MALIQIRGVSDRAHRRLKSRAASEGRSLSEYLRLELEQLAELATLDQALDRVARRKAAGEPAAEHVRAGRRDR